MQSLALIVRSCAALRAPAGAQQLRFSTTPRIAAKPRLPPTPSTPFTTSTPSKPPRDAKPSSSSSLKYTSSRTWKPDPAVPRRDPPPVGSAATFIAQSALPPPTYHIERSRSKNLPIYTDYKRGGNLYLTTVRRITGNSTALRDELRAFLKKRAEDITINTVTGHIVIKGHHTALVADFLRARGM